MGNIESTVAGPEAYGDKTITFIVGPYPPFRFEVYKKLFSHRAAGFQHYFSKGFLYDEEVRIRDVPAEVFTDIVTYLHHGLVPVGNSTEWRMPSMRPLYSNRVIQLYSFAEQHQMNELMNKLLDEWRAHLARNDAGVSPAQTLLIYQYTLVGSKLRRFAAASVAWNFFSPERRQSHIVKFSTLMSNLPGFSQDVSQAQIDFREIITKHKADPRGKDTFVEGIKARDFHVCTFHVHGREEFCHVSKDYKRAVANAVPV